MEYKNIFWRTNKTGMSSKWWRKDNCNNQCRQVDVHRDSSTWSASAPRRLVPIVHFIHTHTPHTHLTALFPGLPRCAGTRTVKTIWILLEQETVSGSGISWAVCKSAPRSGQITTPAPHHSVHFIHLNWNGMLVQTATGRMPFMSANQRCQQHTDPNHGKTFAGLHIFLIHNWRTAACTTGMPAPVFENTYFTFFQISRNSMQTFFFQMTFDESLVLNTSKWVHNFTLVLHLNFYHLSVKICFYCYSYPTFHDIE